MLPPLANDVVQSTFHGESTSFCRRYNSFIEGMYLFPHGSNNMLRNNLLVAHWDTSLADIKMMQSLNKAVPKHCGPTQSAADMNLTLAHLLPINNTITNGME